MPRQATAAREGAASGACSRVCPAMAHEHRGRDYGPLQPVSNHTICLDRIHAHRGDLLLVAGPVSPVDGHTLAIV